MKKESKSLVQKDQETKDTTENPTDESGVNQANGNGLVKSDDSANEKLSLEDYKSIFKKLDYSSVQEVLDAGFIPIHKVVDAVGTLEDRMRQAYPDYICVLDDAVLNDEDKQKPLQEKCFGLDSVINDMKYRGEYVRVDDPSLIRVIRFNGSPSLQELGKFGLVPNYDRYNELLDKGLIDPSVNDMLAMSPEVARELEQRQENNLPAAMQRYGDVIRLKDKASTYGLLDIGILLDHDEIRDAGKQNEEIFNKNLEQMTKKK